MCTPSWIRSLFARRAPVRPTIRPRLEALEDRRAPTNIPVMNTNDTGNGSLRQAILSANASSGSEITFSITGTGTHIIRPASPLPSITASGTVLDATTEPGYNGTPLIQLDGSLAGTGNTANGLVLQGANGSIVRGLAVTGFSFDGIALLGGSGNSLSNDYIGITPAAGTDGNGFAGVQVSSNSQINTIIGNIISGNGFFGVLVSGTGTSGNTFQGNYIGINAAGSAAAANGLAGVAVQAGAAANTFSSNLVSGNGGFGFLLADPGTNSNHIIGNKIGTNAAGTAALGNTLAGVCLAGSAANNIIGDPAGASQNVISGNGANGVFIYGIGTDANQFNFDLIGTNATGSGAVPNGVDGVDIQDGASFNSFRICVVSGNKNNGVTLTQAGTANNTLLDSYIGLNGSGKAAMANGLDGVKIQGGASDNTINTCVISSQDSNVEITDPGTTGNVVLGSFLGTDVSGFVNIGGGRGVQITDASGNRVGASLGNVISGNQIGIDIISYINTPATGNMITQNFIGLNANGGGAPTGGTAQNYGIGLEAGAQGNTVTVNYIGGNTQFGVFVYGSQNTITSNLIGLNTAGNAAIPNVTGVFFGFSALANTLGGTTAAARNVISGNTGVGVLLSANVITGTNGITGNVVEGNYIGVKTDGVTALGNESHGVQITGDCFDNTIGGSATGAGNIIANNGKDGVEIDITNAGTDLNAGRGNAILGNSIYGNTLLGIDLGGDGVTPNGNQVNGQGPNGFLNYPALTSAFASGTLLVIQGTYTGFDLGLYRLEFFANPSADPSGHGQGKTFLGFVTISFQSPAATVPFVLPVEISSSIAGQVISATATDASGDTSEFSADVTVH